MKKDLLRIIEETRYRLHAICPGQKEKLLRESRKLDMLIVMYHKQLKREKIEREKIEQPLFENTAQKM